MTTTSHFVETIKLNPELGQRLLQPRPDIEGIDAKTLAALTLLEYMAIDEHEKISYEEYQKARCAATHILENYRADISGMFGDKVKPEDLELI